jgi:hypothetical protein
MSPAPLIDDDRYSRPAKVEDVAEYEIYLKSGGCLFFKGVLSRGVDPGVPVVIYKPGSTSMDGVLFWSPPDNIDYIRRVHETKIKKVIRDEQNRPVAVVAK